VLHRSGECLRYEFPELEGLQTPELSRVLTLNGSGVVPIAQSEMCVRMSVMQGPQSFGEFWPVYVLAHSQPLTRIVHSVGTLIGWSILIAAIILRKPWLILAAFVVPYTLAWFSHFFIEHNRPATFGHPLWSWLADQKMVAMVVAGRMGKEVDRCAAEHAASKAN
jgi:hypothetical protein